MNEKKNYIQFTGGSQNYSAPGTISSLDGPMSSEVPSFDYEGSKVYPWDSNFGWADQILCDSPQAFVLKRVYYMIIHMIKIE